MSAGARKSRFLLKLARARSGVSLARGFRVAATGFVSIKPLSSVIARITVATGAIETRRLSSNRTDPSQKSPTSDADALARLSAEQQRLLDELIPIVKVGGLAVVSGATGVGKTTLTQALVAGLSETRVAHLVGPSSRAKFVTALAQAWKIDLAGGVLRGVHAVLADAAKTRHSVALIVDDAQALDPETFTELSDLIELRVPQFPARLSIVLVGDRRLDLALATFASQLAARLAFRRELRPLTFDEVSEFLMERLGAAGCETSVLTPRVLSVIAAETHGLPRLVHALCDALVQEHQRGKPMNAVAIQKYVVGSEGTMPQRAPAQTPENRERTEPPKAARSRRLRWSSSVAAAAMVGLGLMFLASRGHSPALLETVTTIPPISAAPGAVSAGPSVAPVVRPEPTPPPPSVEITNRPVEAPPSTATITTPPVAAPPAAAPQVAPPPVVPPPVATPPIATPPVATTPIATPPATPPVPPAAVAPRIVTKAPPRRLDPPPPAVRSEAAPAPRAEVRGPAPASNAVRSANTPWPNVDVSRATAAPAKPASAIEQQSVRAAKPQQPDGADESDRVIDWLLQQRRR